MGLSPGLPVAAGLIDAHAGALAHHRRRARRRGGRPAPPAGADPGHLVLLHGALGRSPLRARRLGAALRRADARPMADRGRPERLRRGDRPAVAHASRLRRPRLRGAGARHLARCGSASAAAALARDLHVLPDFLGNRSPFADPQARGAVLGLDLDEDEASLQALYVAGLCGLAQGLAQAMRALEAGGFAFDALVASGGAARGALVRQIVADVCGRRVVTAETAGAGAAGFGDAGRGRRRPLRPDERHALDVAARTRSPNPPAATIAALHARKRLAFEALQRAERDIRARARAHMAEAGDLRLRRRAGRQRADRARRHPRHPRPPRPRPDAGRERRSLPRPQRRLDAQGGRGARRAAARELRGSISPPPWSPNSNALRAVPFVREAAAALGAPVCVASSSSRERIHASLAIVGYADIFGPRVFSAEEVEHGKPAPDLLLHVAASLGVAPQRLSGRSRTAPPASPPRAAPAWPCSASPAARMPPATNTPRG